MSNKLVEIDKILPSIMPIFPVSPKPLFPGIFMPIDLELDDDLLKLKEPLENSTYLCALLLKDLDKEFTEDNLYDVGVAIKILKRSFISSNVVSMLFYAVKRIKVKRFLKDEKGSLQAEVDFIEEDFDPNDPEIRAYQATIIDMVRTLADQNHFFLQRVKATVFNADSPSKVADFTAFVLDLNREEYQKVLEIFDIKKRMHKVIELLRNQMQIAEIQQKIHDQINEKIANQQREFFLREQLKAIKKELGISGDERSFEISKFRKLLKEMKFEGEILEKVEQEIEKLEFMEPQSSEYAVIRNWLDLVFSLPWKKESKESIDLKKAQAILEKDHYGLDDVKKRILEFLAVRKLNKEIKGSIICLVGPPGVGKTSLGKSIARAMNRKFHRFSLGGMRDEAEIKGHRKTYVGAMPGRILSALKIVKTKNPVIMLDEIDKLGISYQGDPAAALLEVLDPEQNFEFRDNYLEIPFDLSHIFFITTANTLDTIPRPLLDRMEVIRLSGYIDEEKYEIAKKYLVPKQLKKHGLKKDDIVFGKEELLYLINNYARQAGVRDLEKEIEKICRKVATKIALKENYNKKLTEEDIRSYLGVPKIRDDELIKITKHGLSIGLAWTELGGATLVIESLNIPNSKGFKLTGQLGDVMKESANIALSYVRSICANYGGDPKFFDDNEIHIHIPEGATPKDGPSAGITLATSLLSLVIGKKIREKVAMTGELTLTGRVLGIGGLKEKIVAARRAQIKEIILPKENEVDFEEIPSYLKEGIKFHFVEEVDEVFKIVFPQDAFNNQSQK
ncbi:MAG: endopeptidase La [Spirochaetales bacterium]|jgi:ATP-dependent Lon protease|nr:endopeptidase La [Exilispira sp.]NMC67666.1 endopeptidase La [Spirochaetales bacterium]